MKLTKTSTKRVFGFILFLIIASSLALLPHLGRTGSAQKISKEERENQTRPLAVFGAAESGDPSEKAIRHARNSRYDNYNHVPFDQWPANADANLVSSEWWMYVPALPVDESDAVVLGKIVDARGYISNDKAAAYSEFTVKVEKSFKAKDQRSIAPGESLIALRYGADVKLPSGKIIKVGVADQRMPQIGQRYILFLKYNSQGDDYDILTGYKLKKGQVFPLDDVERFAIYKGHDKDVFLNLVQDTITKSVEKESAKH